MMPALAKVMFWLCVAIGVMAGGVLFLVGEKGLGIVVLAGMPVLGLVLRWVFSGSVG